VLFIYTGIAARDLARHSHDVYKALAVCDIKEARRRVGMICGRDVESLDKEGVVRAAIESVAENMVDGVTAPLFFAAAAGPVGIMAYKAVSTLDSSFGYRNELYLEFGWASARLDDIAAFIPARITGLLVPVAALILGMRPRAALRMFLRDRNKHPSPNAAQAEAAVAGALGVQLGGLSFYQGKPSKKPLLGEPLAPLNPERIRKANALMIATSILALFLFAAVRITAVDIMW
jgi:adenosylcobinamide-phosphate synthase